MTLLAFHDDPKVKQKYLARVKAHEELDQLVKGSYWDGIKGCAVGCTIHGDRHKDYEAELGIPEWLARVEDRLFEGMNLERSKKWPAQFLSAIRPGAELEKIRIPFLIIIAESGLDKFDHKKYPKVFKAITEVVKQLKKKKIDKEKLSEARKAAAADAAYAAEAAADAVYAAYAAEAAAYAAYAAEAAAADAVYAAADAVYAAYAAEAAADAAADAVYAAADAVYAAAYADDAAAYAARKKQYEYFADELLKLLKACK